jgi:hypothetical protein
MLHEIPDDGAPHTPSSECPCGPALATVAYQGADRVAFVHHDQADEREGPTDATT